MSYTIKTQDLLDQTLKLYHEDKQSFSYIGRQLGIHRQTVKAWIFSSNENVGTRGLSLEQTKNKIIDTAFLKKHYAYLLGLYLGDGYILQMKRTAALKVYLDDRYPNVQEDCKQAMQIVFPNNIVGKVCRCGCSEIKIHNRHIPNLFPRGTGLKADYCVRLEDWQQRIVQEFPMAFLKGLFHSDGCIFNSKIKNKKTQTKDYVYRTYNFVNTSIDIMQLFIWACELSGIQAKYRTRSCTPVKSGSKIISRKVLYVSVIAKREYVQKLDKTVGDKNSPCPLVLVNENET